MDIVYILSTESKVLDIIEMFIVLLIVYIKSI